MSRVSVKGETQGRNTNFRFDGTKLVLESMAMNETSKEEQREKKRVEGQG